MALFTMGAMSGPPLTANASPAHGILALSAIACAVLFAAANVSASALSLDAISEAGPHGSLTTFADYMITDSGENAVTDTGELGITDGVVA